MANVEQKRADLEKALAALDESEIEAVAGGLSDKGKKVLKYVGIGAGVIGGGALLGTAGYGLYKQFKGKKAEREKWESTTGLDDGREEPDYDSELED